MSDSCYFKTETDEDIADVYRDSIKIRVHPGRINYTLEQTGKGCSYETKGMAEVKLQQALRRTPISGIRECKTRFIRIRLGNCPKAKQNFALLTLMAVFTTQQL
jgi:hypothetical protein